MCNPSDVLAGRPRAAITHLFVHTDETFPWQLGPEAASASLLSWSPFLLSFNLTQSSTAVGRRRGAAHPHRHRHRARVGMSVSVSGRMKLRVAGGRQQAPESLRPLPLPGLSHSHQDLLTSLSDLCHRRSVGNKQPQISHHTHSPPTL